MANLKNITELPMAESAEGLNLIVNDNGAAKQITASAVGAQADWAETDENSPAFIKNKPIEEWDLDIEVNVFYDADEDIMTHSYTVNSSDFELCKNKIMSGIQPKMKVIWHEQMGNSIDAPSSYLVPYYNIYTVPAEAMGEGSPEMVGLNIGGMSYQIFISLLPDNSVVDMTN